MQNFIQTILPKILLLAVAVAILFGVKFILTGLFPYASRKARKTVKVYSAKNKLEESSSGSLSDALKTFSRPFAKFIHPTPIARDEMTKALQVNGLNMTPEEYTAFCYGYAVLFAFGGAILFFLGSLIGMGVYKIAGICLAGLGLVVAFMKKKKLSKGQKKSLDGVEAELPRFVSFIRTALSTNNESILSMLERYTAYNLRFSEELARTIADAKTSSFDGAMARFDQRINSDKLKMVIHGLVCANNGDDVEVYFAMLEKDFEAYEVALLRQNIKTIPGRMKLPKMLMYSAVAFALFLPIVMQIIDSFVGIFGQV